MRMLADVIASARVEWPDRGIVLKVNVEGVAGAVLLRATAADLEAVVELHLDHAAAFLSTTAGDMTSGVEGTPQR